jgi:hypothetical protein
VITTKMGKSPQAEEGVGLDLKNTYKFRIAGTQFTGQTQMVQRDGKWYQAQWQSYTYEMNKVPVLSGTGDLGAIQLPYFNEFNHWTPVTWGQIMQENAQYPGDTFTIPNAFGVPISVVGGVPIITTPTVPIMTNGG